MTEYIKCMLYSTFKPMSHLCRHALYNASIYVFSALNSINTSISKCDSVFFYVPQRKQRGKLFQQNKNWGQIGSNFVRTERQVNLHNNFLSSKLRWTVRKAV